MAAMLSGQPIFTIHAWQLVRQDGVADIQARYTIGSDAGARILVSRDGLRHGPQAVMERLARGQREARAVRLEIYEVT